MIYSDESGPGDTKLSERCDVWYRTGIIEQIILLDRRYKANRMLISLLMVLQKGLVKVIRQAELDSEMALNFY